MMTGGTIETLTLQQAVFSIKAGVTELLAAPALVAISADTGSSYWVTFGPVTALTAVTAVGTPEVALTAWAEKRVCKSTCDLILCNHHYLYEARGLRLADSDSWTAEK